MSRPKGSKNKPKQFNFITGEIIPSPQVISKSTEPILKKASLRASEICYIIRVASKNNVSDLKIGDFCLSFARSQGQGDQPNRSSVDSVKPVAPGSEKAESINALSYEDQQALLDDVRSRQLMIDDPVAYEQLIMDEQGAGFSVDAANRQTQKASRPQSII